MKCFELSDSEGTLGLHVINMLNMKTQITIAISICLLISLLLILARQNTDYSRMNDPHEYAYLGKSLWIGDGLRYNNVPDVVLSPGFPIVIGAVNKIIDNPEWSGKIICMVSFLFSVLLMYNISLSFLFEKKYAIVSVLLFATNSNYLINATNGYSESLFTLAFLAMAFITLNIRRQNGLSLLQAVIFSALWAILYYIRAEGLIIGIILFFWLAIGALQNKILLWLTPIVCTILILPYLFFLRSYSGHWQLSGKTYLNLVMGELNSPYQKVKQDENTDERYSITHQTHVNPAKSLGFGKYWDQPENDIAQRIAFNLIKWGKIYWLTYSVVGIAVWFLGFYKFNKTNILFLLSLFLPAGVYLMFFILPRTIAIYHWIGIIFMVSGLKNVNLYAESRFHWKYTDKLVWAIVLLISLYQIRSVVKVVYTFLA